MTAPRKLTVNLPFPGFYGSAYSDALDSEESQWLEYKTDENNGETRSEYNPPGRNRCVFPTRSGIFFSIIRITGPRNR